MFSVQTFHKYLINWDPPVTRGNDNLKNKQASLFEWTKISRIIFFSLSLGHPSLRFGEAIHFLELWGNNSNNTIVFTEPSFPYLDALAPFQPLQMRTVHCPIDTSLNFSQAKKLVRDLKPGMIATPKCYTSPPASASQRTDLQLELVRLFFSLVFRLGAGYIFCLSVVVIQVV